MSRRAGQLIVTLILLVWVVENTGTEACGAVAPGAAALGHAPGHILVQFNERAKAWASQGPSHDALKPLAVQMRLPEGFRLEENELARWRREKLRMEGRDPGRGVVDWDSFFYVRLAPGWGAEDSLERLRKHPWVSHAELDRVGGGGAVEPNDPDFDRQWHHRNTAFPGAEIGSPAAWEITQGDTNVIVAVLDTGLAGSVVEFAGRTVPGYDFVNNDADPTDDHGHGTAVTGVLAATGQNGALVAGMDWNCRIMPIKVLDASNFGYYSDWAQGVDYAVMNGCKVINLSAGGFSGSAILTTAIRNAMAQGVIFVTITHNDGTGTVRYPGSLGDVITVGATDEGDRRAGFSNYGPTIDLVAPGTNMFTVSRSGALTKWWGTSFSAPLVAGVCSLMAGINPDLTHEEAQLFLSLGADDFLGDATDTPGFDIYHGWGRLNARRSLELAGQLYRPLPVQPLEPPGPLSAGCPVTLSVKVTNQTLQEATVVVVTNVLPSGLRFLGADISQGTHAEEEGRVLFFLGTLEPRQETLLTLTLLPERSGLLTNRWAVVSDQVSFDPAAGWVDQTLTIDEDAAGPELLTAQSEGNGRTVRLEFSERLEEGGATNLLAYQLRDGEAQSVPITGVELEEGFAGVFLQTDLRGRPGPFLLSVDPLRDCPGNLGTAVVVRAVDIAPYPLIEAGSLWRYRDDGSDQGGEWRGLDFADHSWALGAAELGYGDGDETTVVSFGTDINQKHITTYFRHAFGLARPSVVERLHLRLRRDDGAVVYLNGREIFRSNLPLSGLNYLTLAESEVFGGQETMYMEAAVEAGWLRGGTNVVAVEVHQANAASPDLSFDMELLAEPVIVADRDGDGMPDDWETRYGLDPDEAGDGELDADGDGPSGLAEYLAGTNPVDGSSRLKISSVLRQGDKVELMFLASSNRSYAVFYSENARAASWRKLADIPERTASRWETVTDEINGSGQRFYKLAAPSIP